MEWENDLDGHKMHYGGLKILFGMGWRIWHYNKDRLSYITPYFSSQQVCRLANMFYPQNSPNNKLVMWDMFGGIGTDAIFMSQYFNVIVSEIDHRTTELLKYNVKVYKIKNINILRRNCLDLLQIVQPDVVYFDPPWGDNYKSKRQNFDFGQVYLDCSVVHYGELKKKVNCLDLLEYIMHNITTNVIVKSPLNSNSFEIRFGRYIRYIYKYQNRNLKFIFLSSR